MITFFLNVLMKALKLSPKWQLGHGKDGKAGQPAAVRGAKASGTVHSGWKEHAETVTGVALGTSMAEEQSGSAERSGRGHWKQASLEYSKLS